MLRGIVCTLPWFSIGIEDRAEGTDMRKPTPTIDDSDITSVVCHHPMGREYGFTRVKQDRRTYYRLGYDQGSGSLTDAKHARETIAYWRQNGWVK